MFTILMSPTTDHYHQNQISEINNTCKFQFTVYFYFFVFYVAIQLRFRSEFNIRVGQTIFENVKEKKQK